MAIDINVALTIDEIGLAGGRVFRVGDKGIAVLGNRISAFDDDGVVFEALEYEPAPGGFGRIDPYFIHDNEDGTFNLYFRLTGGGLPLKHSDVYITLDAETGAKIGDTHALPFSNTNDQGAMGQTDASGKASGEMLQQAISLSDGTIALVDNTTILNQFVFKIVNPDGSSVAMSTSIGSGRASHNSQLNFDLTEVGDTVAVAWSAPVSIGAPAALRLINKDGSFASDVISLGNTSSVQFGATPAVQLETLANGNILAVWVESGTSSGPDTDQTSTWFSILDANGTQVVAPTMVNTEVTKARQDIPLVITTEDGFVIGYSVLDFSGIQEGRLKEYDQNGALLDTETSAYLWGADDIVRTDNNSAFIAAGNIWEITLPGDNLLIDGSLPIEDDKDVLGTPDHDNLLGGTGNDTLSGLAGDDILDGGIGADLLIGGPGSDRIFVDNPGDRVAESRKWDGVDTVVSSIDFRMGRKHIENLELTGDAILGAGNGLMNRITGNDGDNILDGGKNNDVLIGGAGNDTYLLRAPGDMAVEKAGGGIDVVKAYGSFALGAHVEKLYMQNVLSKDGNPVNFNGIGNGLDNTIIGTPYDNTIVGREGSDTLKGQAGDDTFVFDRAIGPTNVDRIIDFETVATDDDTLKFKGSILGGAVSAGVLDAAQFAAGTTAQDANDRFIFDQASGQLWFDADGNGASDQILVATFEQNAVVEADDILVF